MFVKAKEINLTNVPHLSNLPPNRDHGIIRYKPSGAQTGAVHHHIIRF